MTLSAKRRLATRCQHCQGTSEEHKFLTFITLNYPFGKVLHIDPLQVASLQLPLFNMESSTSARDGSSRLNMRRSKRELLPSLHLVFD